MLMETGSEFQIQELCIGCLGHAKKKEYPCFWQTVLVAVHCPKQPCLLNFCKEIASASLSFTFSPL